ncbi:uncharacterized protein LOC144050812 isoform X2 [Vanacampus margaritifer]
MNVLSSFFKCQLFNKSKKKRKQPHEDNFPDKNDPSQRNSQLGATADGLAIEDRVSQVSESLKENLWIKEKSEREWHQWLAVREKENAGFLSALQIVQDTMIAFRSQLESAKRNMDAAAADLRAQMLSMQESMATGILQRDEHISKLERQNCLLTGHGGFDAATLELEPPQHLPYDCYFAPTTPPFFILRPSGPQYPMPDALSASADEMKMGIQHQRGGGGGGA